MKPVTFFLLFFACAAASAEDDPFRKMDLNGDGQVSLAEAAGYEAIVVKFDRADRNRDGKLSRAEFERMKTMTDRPRSAAAGGSRPQARADEKHGEKR